MPRTAASGRPGMAACLDQSADTVVSLNSSRQMAMSKATDATERCHPCLMRRPAHVSRSRQRRRAYSGDAVKIVNSRRVTRGGADLNSSPS